MFLSRLQRRAVPQPFIRTRSIVEIDPHLSSTKKIAKRPIQQCSATANVHEPTKRFHVATPTINSKNSRHKTNKTGENKHEENTSDHQQTIPTVSRMRYHIAIL